MKSFKFSFITLLSLIALCVVSGASAESASENQPVFALTETRLELGNRAPANQRQEIRASSTSEAAPAGSVVVLDFAAGDKAVSGFQFDVVFRSPSRIELDLSACTSGLPDSHQGFCREIEPGRVRLLVDSPTNGDLSTSNIGMIKVKGAVTETEIVKSSVVAGDANGQKVAVEVL
jgi:hypothetical protein